MSRTPDAKATQAVNPTQRTAPSETSEGGDAGTSTSTTPSQRPSSSAAAVAAEILSGSAEHGLDHYMRALHDPRESVWTQAARVVEEVVNQKPELAAPHIEKLCALLVSDKARVVQCAAHALPSVAKVAPAKVAKHLKTLQGSFAQASDAGKDGLVHIFVALCLASVIYQKRLIDVFEQALREADAKTLPRWVELILPALKGEPYAQARAVAEQRLGNPELPRPVAQRVADLLGIKLRTAGR